jgi:hypothetical protein
MLSTTPSRQPGEDFRRKVASHWGVSYAQLEALALGEDSPQSTSKPVSAPQPDATPTNLAAAVSDYAWMQELPHELRVIIQEQARQHYVYGRADLALDEWRRILTGLEREALALVAHRTQPPAAATTPPPMKRRVRS